MCSICDAAHRVINGAYGNGDARVGALQAEGYCYYCVQNMVNYFLGDPSRYSHGVHDGSWCALAFSQCF